MPDPIDESTGKVLRFLIGAVCATIVLCGWGAVLWQLRK